MDNMVKTITQGFGKVGATNPFPGDGENES
jgi:hypothetical protein